jgi:serine/threonine-protein kinase
MSENEEPILPEELDAVMRAAYRRAAAQAGDSILAAIEALSGAVPRILLRDVADDEAPVVKPDTPETRAPSGRYQIVGELARGGVGVILKGRDVDLGRDVAMKVIRECHLRNPEILRRFVEEAQIGGQLQHPGIVPVYELGLKADRRPYFTMKLVKGRTLAAMLRDRADVAEDRRKLLGVFEQVCQTVAYAHARGVIHRDLKPSNVMVGNFGEVQIVDWGFAKVLSHGGVADEERPREPTPEVSVIETFRTGSEGSESQAGSVMGTPAYMPPEQAIGAIEQVDERSDVFSLGAILTEILTGRPPYEGEGKEVLLRAARSDLEEARERLESCGAESALTELALRCLEPAQERRPRDAGVLAEAIGAHLSEVEERARRSELEAAAAKVRVEKERRIRRLTTALAASILVAVLLGGGGLLWVQHNARLRRERTARTVNEALSEATLLLGRAQEAPVEDHSRWPGVLAAAERAAELAEAAGADEETRARCTGFLAEVREAEALARLAAARVERDREVRILLVDARGMRGESFPSEDRERAFAEAFARAGLPTRDLSPEALVARIRESSISGDLVAALDDWVGFRREDGEGGADETRALEEALRLADPDEFRNRVRGLEARRDLEGLRSLAKSEESAALPRETLLLLGDALGRAGDASAATAVYRVAHREHASDFWTSFGMAWWLGKVERPDVGQALSLFTTARSLLPGTRAAAFWSGMAHQWCRDIDGAIAVWEPLAERAPGYGQVRKGLAWLWYVRGFSHARSGNAIAAIASLREAVRLDAESGPHHALLVQLLVAAMRYEEAVETCRAAIRAGGDEDTLYMRLGQALIGQEEYAESEEALRAALEREPDQPLTHRLLGDALAWQEEFDDAKAAYRRALELAASAPFADLNLGILLCREGRFEEALPHLRRALEADPKDVGRQRRLFRAVRGAGMPEEARKLDERFLVEGLEHLGSGRASLGAFQIVGSLAGRLYDEEEAMRRFREKVEAPAPAVEAKFLAGLGWGIFQRTGRPDTSIPLYERASELAPESSTGCFYLGEALSAIGREEEALGAREEAFRRAASAGNDVMLGHALLSLGRFREALPHCIRALKDRDPAYVRHRLHLEDCPRLIELAADLEAIAGGGLEPADRHERILFAKLCFYRGRFEAACRHFLTAFGDTPGGTPLDRDALVRRRETLLLALRAACRTAGMRGGALTERERDRWRGQALAWAEEMLRLAREGIERFPLAEPFLEAYPLLALLSEADFREIREEAGIAKLEPAEREACRELWREIRELWEWVR